MSIFFLNQKRLLLYDAYTRGGNMNSSETEML